jgi:hypothetical protein
MVGLRAPIWAVEVVEQSAKAKGRTLSKELADMVIRGAWKRGGKKPTRPVAPGKGPHGLLPQERKTLPCDPDAPCALSLYGAKCAITTSVIVPSSGATLTIDKIPARYCVTEASSLLTSHDPLGGFAPRPGYPQDAQERDYRLQSEQGKVLGIAQRYEPSLIFSTAPGALDGLPVVTEDKLVLGGNGRAMATQLVYDGQGGVPANVPRDYLIQHAKQFGFHKADIRRYKYPVLVRTIKIKDPKELPYWSRRLNAPLTQQLDKIALAVSRARFIDAPTLALLRQVGDEETLSDFLLSERSLDFVKSIQRANVIEARAASQFLTKEGVLNADGRELVNDLLVARVIPSADALRALTLSARGTLARSAYYLWATEELGQYNLVPSLRRAVSDTLEMRAQGLTLNNFLRQGGLFMTHRSPLDIATLKIWDNLSESPVKFARVMRRYLQLTRDIGRGQVGLFGAQSPVEALTEAALSAGLDVNK